MDDSFHIEKGIRLARELLLFLADIGLPAATRPTSGRLSAICAVSPPI